MRRTGRAKRGRETARAPAPGQECRDPVAQRRCATDARKRDHDRAISDDDGCAAWRPSCCGPAHEQAPDLRRGCVRARRRLRQQHADARRWRGNDGHRGHGWRAAAGDGHARRLGERDVARHARVAVHGLERLRCREHPRRSGAPERSLRRRLRLDLEVDRLRQDVEPARQHAQPAVPRARSRAGRRRHDARDAVDGQRRRRRQGLQVDGRRADVHAHGHAAREVRLELLLDRRRPARRHAPHHGLPRGRQDGRVDRRRRDLEVHVGRRLARGRRVVVPVLRRDGRRRRRRARPGSPSRRTAPRRS